MRTRSPASLLSIGALILAATASAAVTSAGQSQPGGEHALWKIGAKDGAGAGADTAELKIELNGQERRHRLAPGGGDASIAGRVDQAKHARVEIAFPVETLRQGPNVLTISTLSGSWLLYDALEFRTPAEVEPARAEGTLIPGLEILPGLRSRQGKLYQSARLTVLHLGDDSQGRLKLGTEPPTDLPLALGARTAEVELPDVDKDLTLPVAIEAGGKTLAARTFTLKPQR